MANKHIKNMFNFPWPLVKNHNELKLLTYFHDYFRYVLKMESSKYRQSAEKQELWQLLWKQSSILPILKVQLPYG